MNLNIFTALFLLICIAVTFTFRDELISKFKSHSSPIDWCEANYKITPYVAEFWNTITSVFMGVPPLVAWLGYKGSKFETYEPKLYILWISMFLVSLGSIYFHADLSVAG